MQPIVWRPPTRLLVCDGVAVIPGGGEAGWVSGSLRSALGGVRNGTGMSGTVTIQNGGVSSVAVVSGGSGYPVSARFEVAIVGDGNGARVLANKNASGVVASFTVAANGVGYSAASVQQRNVVAIQTRFDLGPDWNQYGSASIHMYFSGGGNIESIAGYYSITPNYYMAGYVTLLSGASELSQSGLSSRGGPSLGIRVPSRYLAFDCSPCINIPSTAQCNLALYSS